VIDMRIRKPLKERLDVRVSEEERRMVIVLAKRDGVGVADIVRRLVREEYRRHERKSP
jgi:hypothetical protein